LIFGKYSANLGMALGLAAVTFAGTAPARAETRILLFTKAAGFQHASITDGVTMISELAAEEGLQLVVTDDAGDFSAANLATYQAVISLSTTGDLFTGAQQAAFRAFIQGGGGWVGIHAAADAEYSWPWYGDLLGNDAWFDSHPPIQEASLSVEDYSHPGSGTFPPVATFLEEWYNFRVNPRPVVEVILTVDEASYDPGDGAMGDDHPIAWWHEFDGGRAFYTALGHRPETYQNTFFREQIRGAMLWAAGLLVCNHEESLLLEDRSITTEETFTACSEITTGSNVTVSGPEGHAILRAANRVLFADGFTVGDLGRLTVETGGSTYEPPAAR
jgi:type 1 glutamine amidotransferase